jgi:hypothetical protein
MKESISNVWLIGLVVSFILIFSCYIAITVDYSKAFKMKNEMLSILEKNKGFTNAAGSDSSGKVSGRTVRSGVGSLQAINLYLYSSGYSAKGKCPVDEPGETGFWYGITDLTPDSGVVQSAVDDEKYFYCIAKYHTGRVNNAYRSVYYKVRLFYKFELPVLQDFFSIKVEGITDEIYKPVTDIFPDDRVSGDYYS